jgi:excisionase family DNA binding protein
VIDVAQTTLEPSLPSEAEVNLAKDARRVLAARMKEDGILQLHILNDVSREETLNLPASALRIFVRTLEEIALGNAVMLVPVHAEMTTQEAADMLNISNRSLIRLLDEGKIEFRRVGSDRPVRLETLMEYKHHGDTERRKVLEQLAASDRELGI